MLPPVPVCVSKQCKWVYFPSKKWAAQIAFALSPPSASTTSTSNFATSPVISAKSRSNCSSGVLFQDVEKRQTLALQLLADHAAMGAYTNSWHIRRYQLSFQVILGHHTADL
jgi:hypothetical protein